MLKRALKGIEIDSLYHEIDCSDNYLLPEPDGLYPMIIYLKKGKIINMDIQSPSNPISYNKLFSSL